ncbi:hypothetical protein pb186bvf_002262 [Paramecium bursaria]
MSSTYLEQVRSSLSQIEVMEKTIVYAMQMKVQLPNQNVLMDHRINNLMQMIQKSSEEADNLIKSGDGWKQEELNFLSGTGGDVWENFYERYREIKDYHKKANSIQVTQNKVEFYFAQAFAPPFREPFFSGEEHNGRYLDLIGNYKEFCNLKKLRESKKIKTGDYLWYLQHFNEFHEIPIFIKEKEGNKYKKYLNNLLNYFRDFYSRINPLTDTTKIESTLQTEFDRQWDNGLLKGWNQQEETNTKESLFCVVCQKLFQNENTFTYHVSGKKHKKLAKQKEKLDNVQVPTGDKLQNKKLAFLELGINIYKDACQNQLNDTLNLVRKKQSRGYDENDEDGEQQQQQDQQQQDQQEDVSSDEQSPIYNPKNLPLGWDGKPIPYWLYKLHGLGVEYKCEICGNTSYWGRKAFEDHFQGWRHSYGMRCLRIPNTLHFKEITKIQDALSLFRKIQIESDKGKFKPEYEEEYEDTDGNLLTKKTYYDLKKQGLL